MECVRRGCACRGATIVLSEAMLHYLLDVVSRNDSLFTLEVGLRMVCSYVP